MYTVIRNLGHIDHRLWRTEDRRVSLELIEIVIGGVKDTSDRNFDFGNYVAYRKLIKND